MNYALTKYCRLRVYSELQEIEYYTNDVVEEIGLRAIEAPKPSQELASIVAGITALNTGLSLIYHHQINNNLAYYLGPSIGFTKELKRELEYEFRGEEDNDEDTVFFIDNSQILYPWVYRLEVGLSYKLPFNSKIDFGLFYQNQNINTSIVLPSQVSLRVGIRKQL